MNISNYVNQLECEAVAADGRTDCLEYEWEYKSAKGWRKAKDMEKGISYINGNAIVAKYNSSILAYRCVVTDTRNGEKTVSREGGVNSEVHCSILSVTGDMKSSGKITIRYVVEGGTAPYLVHVAASRVTGSKDGREERFSSLMGTDFIEDNKEALGMTVIFRDALAMYLESMKKER